jgi:carbon monoxide dehydrogenase subunit G
MAYQINLTGNEINERLQNIGTAEDVAAADGTLYARISKNADDVDELRDTVGHIDSAQTETDKTVTQHTADISTLQRALKTKANLANGKVPANELPIVTSLRQDDYTTIPSAKLVDEALTAVGNTLEEKINNKVVGLLHWQGVKSTTSEIKAITSAKKGDVWHSNGDGSEWVCTQDITAANADAWTELGTPVNLSGYYTKTEVDKKVKPLADSIGTAEDVAAADGTLYARISKNADDVDELRDTVGHIDSAQTETDKTVTQHTADISTLQRALKTKANLANGKVPANELPIVTSLRQDDYTTIPSAKLVDEALTAVGNTLEEKINNKVVGLLHWQGVKSTTSEIKAITSAKKGDVWHSNGDGSEWVCTQDITAANADAWTELGTPVNLSGYYTKTEVDKKVKPLADSIGTDNDAPSANGSLYARIKKNATDIYDYASKMNSGTLRDLYISAGAVYNEQTGYYELNGLTDITEEQMRVIYEKTWGWWLHLPTLNGFGTALPRTNIPCPDYKIISYASKINLNSIFSVSDNADNLEVVNLRALYTPTGFDEIKIMDFNWAFQYDKKIREVQGIINVKEARFDQNIGGNIETINIKGLKVNIIFYNSQRLSKESVLYMINNSEATSAITIGLKKAVYDVMKDDADIIAALAEKTNITLVQNT